MGKSLLAAVDLGSNSFRLQVARVVDEQIYALDNLKGSVRLGAGLQADNSLDDASQFRALECLARFGERLRGMPPESVRVVGTNTLRIASNGAAFLQQAEAALGFPIEIIAGREEARLIYLGAAHSLPLSQQRRLVVDIGGGSTEFIVGQQHTPEKMESLYMGCVSYSLRYFPEGKLTKAGFKAAELAAAQEVQRIVQDFSAENWMQAIGTSGTARSLSDVLMHHDWSEDGITLAGLERLRQAMIDADHIDHLSLSGVRPDRLPVLAGGLAIMLGIFNTLGIQQMHYTSGALREGVLYDLLGRHHQQDMREVTVQQFRRRYQIDQAQAARVEHLSLLFLEQLLSEHSTQDEYALKHSSWAAILHELGLSIAHAGYHKHSAYILQHADMPGFSQPEQILLSQIVLGHRGDLSKIKQALQDKKLRHQVLALRLAVLFCRNRREIALPTLHLSAQAKEYVLAIDIDWLKNNPLTDIALQQECEVWAKVDMRLSLAT